MTGRDFTVPASRAGRPRVKRTPDLDAAIFRARRLWYQLLQVGMERDWAVWMPEGTPRECVDKAARLKELNKHSDTLERQLEVAEERVRELTRRDDRGIAALEGVVQL